MIKFSRGTDLFDCLSRDPRSGEKFVDKELLYRLPPLRG